MFPRIATFWLDFWPNPTTHGWSLTAPNPGRRTSERSEQADRPGLLLLLPSLDAKVGWYVRGLATLCEAGAFLTPVSHTNKTRAAC